MADPDRLEREIEEILGKIEQFPEPESRRKLARRRFLNRIGGTIADRQRDVTRLLARISVSEVILISFMLILGSFFFRRFNPVVMNWVLYAGIVLFIASFAILVFSRRGGGGQVEQQWRGRSIRYSTGGSGMAARLRRWWSSRGAGRRR